jgi:hypothetical protein
MPSSKKSHKDGVRYDPDLLVSNHPDINLYNPEELEAHIQVLDVRERLRARRRRAIRLFSIAFCVVVVGLLVGLGLMSQWGKSNQRQAAAQQGTVSASGSRLPPPPTDLASKCSPSALETQQGYLICEAACEIADCCSVPEGFALSCSVGNEMACSQYLLYCTALQQTLPAPPVSSEELKVSIDKACIGLDPSALSGSDCMALCRTGFCCFETAGCNDDTNCQTYLNCAAAFEFQEQETPQQTVDNTPAISPDSTTGAIPIHNPINEQDSALKQQIDAICGSAIETVSPPGEDSCESLCALSYCCFDQLCVPPHELQCQDYSACYILFADTNNVNDDITTANLGDEIHEACNGLMDVNDAAKNEACNSICIPGACCFEDKLSCSNVDCAMYAECIILHPSFIAVTKEEVTDACQNHNDDRLQSYEATLCEQVCTLHVMQCCFHEHGQCDDAVLLGDNSVYCDTYQACAVLGTDSSSLTQSHKEELEAACNGGASTRSQCIRLCSSATCCYSSSVEASCVNVDKSITCSDYEACDVLYG